jgi:endoglucanase
LRRLALAIRATRAGCTREMVGIARASSLAQPLLSVAAMPIVERTLPYVCLAAALSGMACSASSPVSGAPVSGAPVGGDMADGGHVGPEDASDATADLALPPSQDLAIPPPAGAITVSGNRLLRDGERWAPHGLNMIAFVAPPAAQAGVFRAAYAHYDAAELSALAAWGADTVRFQVSLPGTDPQNALYTQAFVDQVRDAVRDARARGLNVIVSIQDEAQSGESTPAQLPNQATLRVWGVLAPLFNDDRGVLYEIMNEPQPKVSAASWVSWRDAMNRAIAAIRSTGSRNVVVADGLIFALSLNGAPALTDPARQVAYAIHPYFHSAADQTQTAWDNKFGTFAANAPVIATEWTTVANAATSGSSYFCDSTTATATLQLLRYLDGKQIGLLAFAYDFSGNLFGSAVYGFPGVTSSFAGGAACGSPGYGPGTVIQSWYRSGAVPSTLQ